MTDIRNSIRKKNRQLFFQVQLNWLTRQRGILMAPDVKGSLHIATPMIFGGEGNEWSAEHLFLASISSSYMATFLLYAKKAGLQISRFECEAVGQVDLVDGKYRFTHINVYPKIYIESEEGRPKAEQAVAKTQQHSLVSNSITAEIFYHTEIIKDPVPRHSVIDEV
jgi:organic hydroperoxide reductase OsmC/OhrA